MVDRRRKNADWKVTDEAGGLYVSMKDGVTVAVLMDMRHELQGINSELQHLNRTLDCPNFRAIPRRLAKISSNTANLPKVKKKEAAR